MWSTQQKQKQDVLCCHTTLAAIAITEFNCKILSRDAGGEGEGGFDAFYNFILFT